MKMTPAFHDDDLDAQARAILERNDRGGYTVPTARLYPYQWNWDSAFVALGFATFDRERAWREIDMLLDGQWPDGMIPHILFRRDDPDYFPGPSTWRASLGPIPSGGISQPPVLASVIRQIARPQDRERVAALLPKLVAWHRWWHTARRPKGCPVVATVHPWETGRDNSPDWTIGLEAMAIDPDLEPYTRRDNVHADPAERPSDEQYAKYVTIVKTGRDLGWDQRRLTNEGPFLMADPGIHFILLRADRDLRELAFMCGTPAEEIEGWIEAGVEGTAWLWNDAVQSFCARDVHSGRFADGVTSAAPLCFWADAGTHEQRAAVAAHLRRIAAAGHRLMPSHDPDHQAFEAKRYWCGPVWPQMNHIVARGLVEQGQGELGARVQDDTEALVRASGFRECFDPVTDEGCIGRDFSWTAALWLARPTRAASLHKGAA